MSLAFVVRTREALALLYGRRAIAAVHRYVAVIREGERSGMRAAAMEPTHEVGARTRT
jgi:hypothetical protein